jgi:hypothetical protein
VLDAAGDVARLLAAFAPHDLDRMMFSTDAGLRAAPRGLLCNVKMLENNAALATAPGGAVSIAARRTRTQRDILVSSAVREDTILVVAKDALVSTLGPLRVAAEQKGKQVLLRFCAEMAWAAGDGSLHWIKREVSHERESAPAFA